MKILLTALPRTGKSTIIEKFIEKYEGKKVGILAKEIRASNDERVGFKSVDLQGNEKTFMHMSEINSDVVVGNKYKVDVSVIDDFVVSEITQPVESDTVIIVDEIGRAQSLSAKFLQAVDCLLDSNNNLLCTIVYDNEEWARKYKEHPQVIILEVTEQNRDILPEILIAIYSNQQYFNKLNEKQKCFAINELKQFISRNELDRAKKLFKNAIQYFVLNKFKKVDSQVYSVEGNTNNHMVTIDDNGKFMCDCDLFNGKGKFVGKTSFCSHIDTIRISEIN